MFGEGGDGDVTDQLMGFYCANLTKETNTWNKTGPDNMWIYEVRWMLVPFPSVFHAQTGGEQQKALETKEERKQWRHTLDGQEKLPVKHKQTNIHKSDVLHLIKTTGQPQERWGKPTPQIYLQQIENLDTELIVKISIRGVCHVVNKYEPISLSLHTGKHMTRVKSCLWCYISEDKHQNRKAICIFLLLFWETKKCTKDKTEQNIKIQKYYIF